MMQTIGRPLAVRTAAMFLAGCFVAGCSGATGGLLPGRYAGSTDGTSAAGLATAADAGERIPALIRIRIPRGGHRAHAIHPATISPLTLSLKIAVNGGKATTFNTTPASPGCTVTASGVTCTFAVHVKAGTDTFAVTTYSGAGGTGTALDRGVVTVPIKKGKKNSVAVTLGPVVTTTGDSGIGSLRYAVGSANSGDTIMFLLPAGATIALSTPISIVSNVTIAGPGASSLAISGGGTHQIFLVAGTATISGVTLTNGKAAASNPGGAIYNIGSLTLAKDVIGSSTSIVAAIRHIDRKPHALRLGSHNLHPHTTTYNVGGAIYNDGTLAITGTTFNGNVIQSNLSSSIEAEGGAIYNDQFGSLTSTGDTYSNNSAVAGGAVYNAGLGLVSFSGDTFTGNTGCNAASGCATSGCSATSCTSFAIGEGAAIFDHGLGVTVVNSAFTNNVAGGATAGSQGDGAAIFLDSTSLLPTINGDTFTGNVAGGGTTSCSTGEGGAIVATNSVVLNNDTFKNNSASGDHTGAGGALVAQMDVTGTGDTFTGNTAAGSGGPCTASGNGLGGAIYAGGVVTMSSSTFSGNSASGNYEGAAGAIGAVGNIVVSGSTFTSNSAHSTGIAGAASNQAAGGAILGSAIVKITSNTFTSNSLSIAGSTPTEAAGGAVIGSTAVVSTNNTFTSNSVTTAAPVTTAAGGGLVVASGTLVSNGDTFTSNSVTNQGGVAGGGGAIVGAGGCIVSNLKATSNTATGSEALGGGFGTGAACNMNHVTITGNTVTSTTAGMLGAGGGLVDTGGSTILDSKITGNSATNGGGGIVSENNPEIISNSTVSGNTVTSASAAHAGGGGIAATAGLELDAVTISNNTVTIGGPGPDGGGGIFDTTGVLAIDSTISGNKVLGTAPNSGGGGIYTTAGIFGNNVTISDNASSVDGGGLYLVSPAAASLGNGTVFRNSATGNGGNANIGSGAGLALINSILAGGTAVAGPDAFNGGTLSSGDYNIIQTAPAGNAISGTTTHNIAADPKLLPLANNGGATFTHADQAYGVSPGAQYITFAGSSCGTVSVSTDQRGFTRGAGGKCDVGAYEYAGVATAARHRNLPKPHFRRAAAAWFSMPHLTPLKLRKITFP